MAERAVELASGSAYFCGESSFFSLHSALQTIAREKLTGTLRAFLARDFVELLARGGGVVVVTTRNPSLYCQETPVTLLNVDDERIEAARARQAEDGCPMFITLAREGLILRERGHPVRAALRAEAFLAALEGSGSVHIRAAGIARLHARPAVD